MLKKKKVNSGKNVQSKGHVNFCKVSYHLLRISVKGPERLKEQYIDNSIDHPLLMQYEIFGY